MKEVYIKMAQVLEKINRKMSVLVIIRRVWSAKESTIPQSVTKNTTLSTASSCSVTQSLLEFSEKEPGRLITRNKKGGIEKLREFKYLSPKVFTANA